MSNEKKSQSGETVGSNVGLGVWVVRFRYIAPYDYHTPMCYLPEQETHIEATSVDEAWEKLVTDEYAGNRDYYQKLEIFPHPWKTPNVELSEPPPMTHNNQKPEAKTARRNGGSLQ